MGISKIFKNAGKDKGINQLPSKELMPKHLGIIMDGNGRWARRQGLPRSMGHRAGAETFRKIATYCKDIGIKYLTVYAFSTENWKRPQEEVNNICDLLRDYIKKAWKELNKENTRLRFIGDISPFPKDIKEQIRSIEKDSCKNDSLTVNIAINYGGRAEIVKAVNGLLKAGVPITEEGIGEFLYTSGQPEPDLIIRPSGELRLSNFLLWQSAYAEFWFSDVLWPDFKPKHLNEALRCYSKRSRRFGGI